MEINTYTHELVKKYLTNDQLSEMHVRASKILSDIEYLKAHASRTCEHSFLLVPNKLGNYYGDGKLVWKIRNILANQHYWLSESYNNSSKEMFSYTLVGVDCAFQVSSTILWKIFSHPDKDEINAEFVPDFITWTDYMLNVYSDYIRDRDELVDIAYHHSSRYCQKLHKYLDELIRLTLLKEEEKSVKA